MISPDEGFAGTGVSSALRESPQQMDSGHQRREN